MSPGTIPRCRVGWWGAGAALLEHFPGVNLQPPTRRRALGVPTAPSPVPNAGCLRWGHGARSGAAGWQSLAGAHEAEPGIDFLSIPCNHILQRLLSYISIPHLRL